MIPLLQRLGVMSNPTVTRERALELAKVECETRGWPWQGPTLIDEGWKSYTIRTNIQSRGGNVIVRIAKDREAVISATFIRR